MNSQWTPFDTMDLEYFCHLDEAQDSTELHRRDRQIYLDASEGQPAPPAQLLAWWLARRRAEASAPLPGAIGREALGMLRFILLAASLALGGGVGLAFFSYSGATPVNVLHFLALFVFSQLLLTLVLLIRGGLARLGRGTISRSLPMELTLGFVLQVGKKLARKSSNHFDAGQRLALEAALGRLRANTARHGPFFFWPLFTLLQLAGIMFNVGLLGATSFRLLVSDIAFGWQSTLQFSVQSLHGIVSWLALPWSWLFPEGTGYPTLAEIEGSHILLKAGIANLQTPDLISWWPFLLLSVLVYGLGLRVMLAGYGFLQAKRQSTDTVMQQPAVRQVIRRMQTPLVSSQAAPETPAAAARPAQGTGNVPPAGIDRAALAPAVVLVPDEIFDAVASDELSDILALDGYAPAHLSRFLVDYHQDQHLLEELATSAPAQPWQAIVILMEAWMVPLVDFLTYLGRLREVAGERPIMIRLVGKASSTTPLTAVTDPAQLAIWRQKTDSLGDPGLTTTPLITSRDT